eukprot:tig00000331_g24153.t2
MTVPAKPARPGLRSRDGGTAVPLKALLVTAVIDGYCCETTLRHTFKHEGLLPVEVVYGFQVPEYASVSGFEARIGPAEIAGKVGDAHHGPDAGASAGAPHAAAGALHMGTTESDCSDGFLTLDSGRLTLAPNAEATFTVSIVHELPPAGDGAARFALPSAALLPDEDLEDAPVDVSVDLSFSAPLPLSIGAVRSPTHASQLAVIREGDITRVTIGPVALKRCGGALAVEAPMDGPAAFLWSDAVDGKGPAALALSAAPSWPAMDPVELEIFFALDRALGKQRLEQAKSAVRTAVRSLPHGAHFDILAFGSDVERLCPASGKPQAFSEKGITHADKFLEQVAPAINLAAGADLLGGLTAALDCAGAPGRAKQRQVILVTAGRFEGSEAAFDLAHGRVGVIPRARVFVVGTCEPLAAALARAGAGFPEFVPEAARLEGHVLRQLRRCVAPGLGRLAADWGLPRTLQAPRELPPFLFVGDRLTVYAFGSETGHELPEGASLSGRFAGAAAPLTFGAPCSLSSALPLSLSLALTCARTTAQTAARLSGLSCRHGIASRGTPYAAAAAGEAAAAGVALHVPSACWSLGPPGGRGGRRMTLPGPGESGPGERGAGVMPIPEAPTAEQQSALWRCLCCSGLGGLMANPVRPHRLSESEQQHHHQAAEFHDVHLAVRAPNFE